MPSPTDFNLSPYYDDFAESKKFHRILFRPAFAVQARELTQLQSIQQNQIERLSDHLFEQGAMVIPGEIGYDTNYYAVKLSSLTGTLANYVGSVFTGGSSGVQAIVVNTVATDGTDPNTLFVKYIKTGSNNTEVTFTDSETITGEYSGETATLDASTSTTTNASRISYRYERVPYNLSLQLAVAAKTTEDGLKVVEQILPFFTPEFTVTIRDVVKHDMPVLLSSITQDDTWEGDFTERRFIIWSLDFEVKSYLYGPSKDSNIITKTITQIYANSDLNVTDFTMNTGGSGTFRVGEVVFQGTEYLLATSTATVTSWTSSTRVLQVTGIKNTFDLTEKIRGSESGAVWILSSKSTLFESPTSTVLETAAARIVQEPDPITADADDKWDVTTTITENP